MLLQAKSAILLFILVMIVISAVSTADHAAPGETGPAIELPLGTTSELPTSR